MSGPLPHWYCGPRKRDAPTFFTRGPALANVKIPGRGQIETLLDMKPDTDTAVRFGRSTESYRQNRISRRGQEFPTPQETRSGPSG